MRAKNFATRADGSLLATLAALYASGELRTHIDSVFSLPKASHALARSMSGHVRGKVTLDVAA
ncbi:zinc-binding dehydrogenase [Burkholderia ambifaria]|nr:zinc-binding dehydrogenase [Burkholderia ambifaria]QDW54371.1 zinc-binding dehydrogenase [Burkholderia sp. KBS0801]